MDPRPALNPSSSIHNPIISTSTHIFHLSFSSLGFWNREKLNRLGRLSSFNASNTSRSLQSPFNSKFRVCKSGKSPINSALNVTKDTLGGSSKGESELNVEGEVILKKASLLELTDYSATFVDEVSDFLGKKVCLQPVSSNQIDPKSGTGKVSEVSYLEWNPWDGPIAGDKHYKISFKWNTNLGEPGAFLIRNKHPREFFLKSLTIDVPGGSKIGFHCNSWISPEQINQNGRAFFANKSHLPHETPEGLKALRSQDLVQLRGTGTGQRKDSDRVYDYDVYNDLGNPDKDPKVRREVIGGSEDLPYPRRCRTGRPPTKSDPAFESPSSASSIFVPPDERFPHADYSDLVSHNLVASLNTIVPTIHSIFTPEFESLEDIKELYVRALTSPHNSVKSIELVEKAEDSPIINFERPQVFDADENAWKTDEEFARQTLSGVSSVVNQCLQKFPPSSSLDAEEYGPQQSSITAIRSKRLFILDYHDMYIPHAARINSLSDDVKTYASRTVFFLTSDGTLKPVAIELSLGATKDCQAEMHVYTPGEDGTEEDQALWLLAKTHVRINEAGYHQVIGHWLLTHAILEPIIIATHRQLRRLHTLYKLLVRHFLNTMDANQVARQSLLAAGGFVDVELKPPNKKIQT